MRVEAYVPFLQRVRIARNAERCTSYRGIRSVRPSVRLSVTLRYCVPTNEDTILRFAASDRTIPLVSGNVKLIRIFDGNHPQRGHESEVPSIDSENLTNNRQ